ncbi:MAG: carboxypeptidase-like regulatory domain-containing protein, partial [Bacteroidota bacterium]
MKKHFYFRVARLLLLFSMSVNQAFSQDMTFAHNAYSERHLPVQDATGSPSISLKEALKQLETQFNVHFTYNEKTLEGRQVQLGTQATKDVDQLLKALLKTHGLQYKRYKKPANTYFIFLKKGGLDSLNTQADDEANLKHDLTQAPLELTIQGKVTGEAGDVLPGVNVLLKGTTNGTATNSEGGYSITVPNGEGALVFSFIGYITQEVSINNQTNINISLLPDVKALSEVVVVGYGTQKKSDLTSAISSIDNKKLAGRPVQTTEALLQGQVAGLTVINNGG